MNQQQIDTRLIELDEFPFEFLSKVARHESWRKEIHRPIYHVHKWWAKRLGTVFRGILLGSVLDCAEDLRSAFYRAHSFSERVVFDPFMGSGTTVGEAHKLGFTALGRDINPVAVQSVATALGPMDRQRLHRAFEELSVGVGKEIRSLYRSTDSAGHPCDVLYYFWVMQTCCPKCKNLVDLFPSYVFARNARPDLRPAVQIVCPQCHDVFAGRSAKERTNCPTCTYSFDPSYGTNSGKKATCPHCDHGYTIIDALDKDRGPPTFRLYAKLTLSSGRKEYSRATPLDLASFDDCSKRLNEKIESGALRLPELALEHGYNTRQAIRYGFRCWRQFFNDRQLLALGMLRQAISKIDDSVARQAMATLFSGVLEFNNLFASYKGEGTGAVRHMFSHHILKPERTPIEAHVWGTPKSSGSFSTLFRTRLLRALEYRLTPTEVSTSRTKSLVCSPPFSGELVEAWPEDGSFQRRALYLSCGDSSATNLPDASVDLIITDPPFFDNVHYSELADFFYAWHQIDGTSTASTLASTRNKHEVQDSDVNRFAAKLSAVFRECCRVLNDNGLLVFTYHHSRHEGWRALAEAILDAGFVVVNSHPVRAEMTVATPKSQAKDPIQLDTIIVCRKASLDPRRATVDDAVQSARQKIGRLQRAGLQLSRNDQRVVLFGQLLTTLADSRDSTILDGSIAQGELALDFDEAEPTNEEVQQLLFGDL